MDSKLAPLYENFLYAQADFAHKNGLPGFLSTVYDSKGSYRQMGVPEIAAQPVDRSDVAVGFATAMAMLIDRRIGAIWLNNFYNFPGVLTQTGAVESVGSDGYADIFTADGKGMTILASTGGVVSEVELYLKNNFVPGTDITMYDRFVQLLDSKYEQMMEMRENQTIYTPTKPYPLPAENQITVETKELPSSDSSVNLNDYLQPGHLHGKNVSSLGYSVLIDDVRSGGILEFEFSIPVSGDQWAFRGTYLSKGINISEMNYLVVSIPADSKPHLFDIELKRDDTRLATARINTTQEGVISEDGLWKTIVVEINPDIVTKTYSCNYIAVAIHNPANLPSNFRPYGREGVICLNNILITKEHPFLEQIDTSEIVPVVEGGNEIVQYWSPSHGNLDIIEDNNRDVIRISNTYGAPGWRGGYISPTDISGYGIMVIKVRNISGKPNSFYIELKNEQDNILGKKRRINLPSDFEWHIISINIPWLISKPANYLAISDPECSFELSSIAFIKN
ncbi:MAG: hypothetical protein P9L98_05065 [Candidatus Kaelpia imicola]|nr:hypothetical protein [Candidatus Kaelpia imicola]